WAATVVKLGITEPAPELSTQRWISLEQFMRVANNAAGRVTETVTPILLPLYTRALRVRKRVRRK
ncbi:MAG: hypothetical protein GQ526_09885, partial [Ardenticatenales bacterium]|nr:hypothetical protein [Ardenticatenales bacterium]